MFDLKIAGRLLEYSHEYICVMSVKSFQRDKKMSDPTRIVKCLRKIGKVKIYLKR